jgi:hypothetical protein
MNNMINELPAIRNNNEMVFTRLGEYEDIDMTLNRKTNQMTFHRLVWNHETDDWDSQEVYLRDIGHQLAKYGFLTIAPQPLNIKQLQAFFSHKMLALPAPDLSHMV